jgi:hypothetical protein
MCFVVPTLRCDGVAYMYHRPQEDSSLGVQGDFDDGRGKATCYAVGIVGSLSVGSCGCTGIFPCIFHLPGSEVGVVNRFVCFHVLAQAVAQQTRS